MFALCKKIQFKIFEMWQKIGGYLKDLKKQICQRWNPYLPCLVNKNGKQNSINNHYSDDIIYEYFMT